MATAVLFGGTYAPDLSPLGLVTSDTADRTLSLLPTGSAARAQKFTDTFATNLSPLGLITSDTADRTLSLLPASGNTRAQKFTDTFAPQLGTAARISAFGLTSNEPIVLGTGTGTGPAVTTQSWYIG